MTTNTLKGTTVGQASGHLKFEPNSGTQFATVPISECKIRALNNTFPVTGSVVATTSGATTTTTHTEITGQGTLEFGGVEAGLEGALTTKTEGETETLRSRPHMIVRASGIALQFSRLYTSAILRMRLVGGQWSDVNLSSLSACVCAADFRLSNQCTEEHLSHDRKPLVATTSKVSTTTAHTAIAVQHH